MKKNRENNIKEKIIKLKNKYNLVLKQIKKRTKAYKIDKYNKGKLVHKKQICFHKCTKRNRWVFGGNRTGKTECGAVECVWIARGNHPYRKNKPNTSGWVVSLSTQVQRDVAQKKVLDYLKPEWIDNIVMLSGRKDYPEQGIIDYIVINNIFGGKSTIGFKSCDQGREKFQGTSLDYVWFDEEPPKDIYMECKMRVIDKCGDIFGTMTPLKGLTWVYDTIYLNKSGDDEIWYEFISWQDNPFLNADEINSLKSLLSTEELQSRCDGKFISDRGSLVYSDFDENLNVIEPFTVPKEWYDNISIDPGYNNATSVHWYAVDYDGNVYVIAEHYASQKDIYYHCEKILEISKKLGWKTDNLGRVSALIDSAANQRTLASNKSVAELFYENKVLVNTKVNKDLFSGIQKVRSYIKNANGNRRLFIFKNCTNLIREIKTYYWGDGENPVKKDDHCLDELRYYIMSRPEAPSFVKQKSIIEIDKEKLIRKLHRKNFNS